MLTSPEWCVTSRLPESDPLTSGSFLGHRLPSQINTCLFCTLCPHSCAPGKNFPVGHPSPNFSGPSILNLGVLWRPASGKEVATCWYEYPINPIKSWAGVSQLPTVHEPLMITHERLVVACISDCCSPPSLINEVHVVTPQLLLHGFVKGLDPW